MTVAVAAPPVERYRWTVDLYHQMIETGILGEDERIELITGALATMSPIGAEHSGTLKKLTEMLFEQLRRRAVISVQDPLQVDDYSEPEPDLALLAPRRDFYKRALPRPADVRHPPATPHCLRFCPVSRLPRCRSLTWSWRWMSCWASELKVSFPTLSANTYGHRRLR